jgi:triosephosphate isomerase (TIM)
MRSYVIAGNWKMNAGANDGCELATDVARATEGFTKGTIVVAPPFTALAAVSSDLAGTHVQVSGQNLYPKDGGAYTGEVSPSMLVAAGAVWVILGHSERRQYFAETDEFVREKVAAAMKAGLRPIACIGETLAEREAGKTLEVVFRQLDALSGELAKKPGFGVIAYEPVWAIGTGKVATTEQAQEVHGAIRKRLAAVSAELANETSLLYGGSVKADNAASLLSCPDIDGALVGGASLDATGFANIARAVPG